MSILVLVKYILILSQKRLQVPEIKNINPKPFLSILQGRDKN